MLRDPELQLYVAGEWRAKDSGYGRECGTEGLECYTVAKTVSHLVL
jgi:hypothetical protein